MGRQSLRHRDTSGYWQVHGVAARKALLSQYGEAALVFFRHLFLKDTISHQKMELAEAAWEVSTRTQRAGKQPPPDFQKGEKRHSLNFLPV